MNRLPAILMVLLVSGCSAGVVVEVSNGSREPLKELVVDYNGEPVGADELGLARKARIVLRPTRETGATLLYKGRSGQSYACDLHVYLEPGFRGVIPVIINEDGCEVGQVSIATSFLQLF